jgi:Na+/melibiose symporter-like transporter
VAAIGLLGFPLAAAILGLVMISTVWILADVFFSKTPQDLRLIPDGEAPGSATVSVTSASALPLPGRQLWSNLQFITLASGMALGLFAQIGLIAHLFSLLVPALGAQLAGVAAGAATAAAIAGRTVVGWLMPVGADRRLFACASTLVQITGSLMFWLAAGNNVPLLLLGVVLFGAGIGNTTSLPPLIAQTEFLKDDVPRVVPLIIAMGQATYAFAPASFGLVRELAPALGAASAGAAPHLFITAAVIQCLSILAFLAGRRR